MPPRSKAEAALLATTLIWGGTFVAMKLALQGFSPLLMVAIRFLIAALLFLLLFWHKIFPIHRASLLKGTILGLFLFLGFVSQTFGLKFTTASKSAFITALMVVGVPLLQLIIERRPPKLGNIIGVVIVSVGLWFLTSPTGTEFNVGDALTLVCACMFAMYIVYLDVVSQEMTALQLTFLQTAATAVLAWISVSFFEPIQFNISSESVLSLLYLTLFATVGTTYIQTRFQKDTTPTRAAIIFTIEPIFASLIAYAILDEQLGPWGVFGGALIVTGVLLSELSDSIPLLNRSFGLSEEEEPTRPP